MKAKTPAPANAPSADDLAMMAVILEKAKAGSVEHAALLADAADYGQDGVHASLTQGDLEAVLAAMTEKAEAPNKKAARLVPKLQKAVAVVKGRVTFITRG
jgi:hypothetical protein